jgi:TM2 domain-containing membrane protein YozV
MKGRVLDFIIQTNSGIISGDDGRRYSFSGAEWRETMPPRRGMLVDFDASEGLASAVYRIAEAGEPSRGMPYRKDKTAAGLLALFLGGLGIHKFYLGHFFTGLFILAFNTAGLLVTWIFGFVPNYVLWFITIIEGIVYLTRSDEEFNRINAVENRTWF